MNITPSIKNSMAGWVVLAAIYFFILGSLLVLIFRLTPSPLATITNISIDTKDSSLIIEGSNLTENLSAVITPTLQTPQTVLSTNSTWGKIQDIVVQGHYAWLANGPNGIICYDLQNPHKPELKVVMPLKSNSWRLAIDENKLLVAAGQSGIFGIDIHEPDNPELIFKNSDYIVMDLTITDNIAILATAKHGLIFLDISDFTQPKQILSIPLTSNLQSVTVHNSYLYSTGKLNSGGVLHSFDISNPHQPKHVATVELPETAWECAIFDNQLMLALGSSGVYSCDISMPQKPAIPTKTIIDHNSKGLCTSGNTIFVTSHSDHIYQYTSDHGKLHQKNTLLLSDNCSTAATYNNLLLAAQVSDNFVIIDPSCAGINTNVEVEIPAVQYRRSQVYTFGNNICVSSANTLHLLRALTDESIELYDSIEFEENIRTVAIDEKFAYVALNNYQVHILSLNPKELQSINTLTSMNKIIKNIYPYGDNIYISVAGNNLISIDINTKKHTQASNSINTYSIRSGSFIYVATAPNCLEIYRVEKGDKTRLISTLDYSTPLQARSLMSKFIISGTSIIITNGSNGLLSIDISNPENPKLVSSLELGGFCDHIVAQGNIACVTTNYNKIKIVDISNPWQLKELCEMPATRSVAFMHDKLLKLTDRGIAVLPIPQRLPIIHQDSDKIRIRLPQINRGNFDLQIATKDKLSHYSDLLKVNSSGSWEIAQPFSLPSIE